MINACPHSRLTGKDNTTRCQRTMAPILLVTMSGATLAEEK